MLLLGLTLSNVDSTAFAFAAQSEELFAVPGDVGAASSAKRDAMASAVSTATRTFVASADLLSWALDVSNAAAEKVTERNDAWYAVASRFSPTSRSTGGEIVAIAVPDRSQNASAVLVFGRRCHQRIVDARTSAS